MLVFSTAFWAAVQALSAGGGCRCAPPLMSTAAEPMLMRRIGNSDLVVSECCLGGMTWGNQNSEADAGTQMSFAFDNGVNFIDTAEGYPVPMRPETQGATDVAIAKWLKSTQRPRDSLVLSTKVCGYNDRYTWFRESGEGTQLSKAQIHESVDTSLKRLGTDYIDLLQFHWPERSGHLVRPIDAATVPLQPRSRGTESFAAQVEAIGELLAAGKIRAWGLSNENAEGVREFTSACTELGVAPPACVQNAYSLLQRDDEKSLLGELGLATPADSKADLPNKADSEAAGPPIGYLPYSPLSGGVLSGKYAATFNKPSATKKRSRLRLVKGYEESFLTSDGPKAVEAYIKVARKHGLTPTQLAIAMCNSRKFVTSTIIGATATTQLLEDLAAFRVKWTQEMEEDVLAIYNAYPDPWRVQVAGMG